VNDDDDLRASTDIQVRNEASDQIAEVKNQTPQIKANAQEDVENPPPQAKDGTVEIQKAQSIEFDLNENRDTLNPPPRVENSPPRVENPPPQAKDGTVEIQKAQSIEFDLNENRDTLNPPPRVENNTTEVRNDQPIDNIQQANEQERGNNLDASKQDNNVIQEQPQQQVQQQAQQDVPQGVAPRRLTPQELFAKRQEDLIKASGVPIAAIRGTRGITYITQSEEGKFYALTQGPRGIRRVEMNKSFRPENLWQNPRAIINPNVALDPATGRFKAIQQEQQPEAGQQVAQPPAQAGGNIWNPGVWNREQFNNIPQPGGGDRPAAESNRIAVVRLQPGTRFRFYEETMTLVVE